MAILANRYWILLALILGAVVSYSVGFMVGLGLLVAVGVVLELAVWFELFRRRRPD